MVVTTNDTFGFRLTHELFRSAGIVYRWSDFKIEQHDRYPITNAEMDRFVGDYGIGIHILRTSDGIICKLDQEEQSVPLVAWSPTRFIMSGISGELDFNVDPISHQAISLDVKNMQAVFNVKKATPAAAPGHDKEAR